MGVGEIESESTIMRASVNSITAAYLALLSMLVGRAVYYADPIELPGKLECKKSVFGCSKGCAKVQGGCVPKADAVAPTPPSPPAGPSGHTLMKHRSVKNCLGAADAFEAAADAAIYGKSVAELQLLAADALNCAHP